MTQGGKLLNWGRAARNRSVDEAAPWWIALSAALVLVAAAGAKISSAASALPVLRLTDPVLLVTNRVVLLGVAMIELLVALALVFCRRVWMKGLLLLWLGTNFFLYRGALFVSGARAPCPCFGHIGVQLGLSSRAVALASQVLAWSLLLAGVCLLRVGRSIVAGSPSAQTIAREPGRGRAFSLVELLVVMAVVAVLAALLLPSLARAKGVAQSTRCRSNLRQLTLAVSQYTLDQGVFPPFLTCDQNRNGVFLDDLLRPSTASGWLDPVYQCPGYRGVVSPGVLGKTAAESSAPRGAYGYNAVGWDISTTQAHRGPDGTVRMFGNLGLVVDSDPSASWPAPPMLRRAAEVRVPSDMIALADSLFCSPYVTKLLSGNTGAGDLIPNFFWDIRVWRDDSAPPFVLGGEATAEQARHNGTFNVSFADGHVEGQRPAALLSTNALAMRRWNYDHQPHPEVLSSIRYVW